MGHRAPFIPAGTSGEIQVDLKALRMSITNYKGHTISVALHEMEEYLLAFQIGNAPGTATVTRCWWKRLKIKTQNKHLFANTIPISLQYHFANR